MKKLLLVFGFFITSLGYSQQAFKINISNALIIKSLDISYESYVREDSSFGISVLFNLAKQDVSFRYNENIMITPYIRHYFTTDQRWNFFLEGFLGINYGKEESKKTPGIYDIEYIDGALGIVMGTKYISTGNLVLDFYGGLGRNLFGSNSPTIVPRIGLNIGWRF